MDKVVRLKPIKFEQSAHGEMVITVSQIERGWIGIISKRDKVYIAKDTIVPNRYWRWGNLHGGGVVDSRVAYMLDDIFREYISWKSK